LVKDIQPGGESASPRYLTNINGTLFFRADDGTNGRELWKSDGTEAGTVLVKDILPGEGSAYPSYLTNINGTLFFTANDGTTSGYELWKSDGTEAGTVKLRPQSPVIGDNSVPAITQETESTNNSPATAADLSGSFTSAEPGGPLAASVTGTVGVSGDKDYFRIAVSPDAILQFNLESIGNSGLIPLVEVRNRQDGLLAGSTGSSVTYTVPADGSVTEIFVVARDFSSSTGDYRLTVRDTRITFSDISNLTNINGTLFFSADDGTNGRELWKSDGTEAGTVLVKDIQPGGESASPRYLTNINGTLFFTADNGTAGTELWKSDGKAERTVLVKDIFPGGRSASPGKLTNVNATLFFTADNGTSGFELWKSDGTEAGTIRLEDLEPGVSGSSPENLIAVNNRLFFTASVGSTGTELFLETNDNTTGFNPNPPPPPTPQPPEPPPIKPPTEINNASNNSNLINGLANSISGTTVDSAVVTGILATSSGMAFSADAGMGSIRAAEKDATSTVSFVATASAGVVRDEFKLNRDERDAIVRELRGFLDLIHGGTLERVLDAPYNARPNGSPSFNILAPAIDSAFGVLDSAEFCSGKVSDLLDGVFRRFANVVPAPLFKVGPLAANTVPDESGANTASNDVLVVLVSALALRPPRRRPTHRRPLQPAPLGSRLINQ
jgi:ELWxxDGT repeat protein